MLPRTRTRPRYGRMGPLVASVDIPIYEERFLRPSDRMDWQGGLGCEGWRSDQQVSLLCWRYCLTACPGMPARAATVSGSDDNDEGACSVLDPEWSLLILKDCVLGPPLDRPLLAVVSALRPIERRVRHYDSEHLRNHRVSLRRNQIAMFYFSYPQGSNSVFVVKREYGVSSCTRP